MNMRFPIMAVKGLLARVPGLYRPGARGTGNTDLPRYCYSVWLRHLVMACRHGMAGVPESIAELGPGDSIGTGLAAMLSGAGRYYALDVVPFAYAERNLRIFDALASLFEKREAIPGPEEFPNLGPALDSYAFPHGILPAAGLERALARDRLDALRGLLANPGGGRAGDIVIRYCAPWHDAGVIEAGAVDMVFSQSVLQHVDDLERTLAALRAWLRPGGYTSHQINLSCHGTAPEWNGHWAYGDWAWRVLRGGRAYLINRQPHSAYLELLERHGFEVVSDVRRSDACGIGRERLAPRFRAMSDEDLATRSAFIAAVKRD
jgi:SAM-dependent methyltransferase